MPPISLPIPALVLLNIKLRDNIRHAKLICPGHEDTRECKIAWDQVEAIQKAIHVKHEKEKMNKASALEKIQRDIDERSFREYDV
jgi:hypothetical protein